MTTDETIARYTRLKETHEAHVDPADIKPETLAIWQLLDRISELQARCTELERDSADTLLEDLEQDVIAEMHSGEGRITKTQLAWNEALDWVLERLKTYRKE